MEGLRSSLERVEASLFAIDSAGNNAESIFTQVYARTALKEAQAADDRLFAGKPLSAIDGYIISVKDLFDVRDTVTTAGSLLLKEAKHANLDSFVVQRIRDAGGVIIGKTNMSEFAFSGIGLNPHFGTPKNALEPLNIPGGSSSGAAVAVARGLCDVAIGSDTGGSVRIPAALNGVIGFKPSQNRISRQGMFPLSPSLDAVGLISTSLSQIDHVYQILLDEAPEDPIELPTNVSIDGGCIGVVSGLLMQDTDAQTLADYENAIACLSRRGFNLIGMEIDDSVSFVQSMQRNGSLVGAEAARIHAPWMESRGHLYDPLILSRLNVGRTVSDEAMLHMRKGRIDAQRLIDGQFSMASFLLLPTVPIQAPSISSLATSDEFFRVNGLLLRNTAIFNFCDLPALSFPIPTLSGRSCTSVMLVAKRNAEKDLLNMASHLKRTLQ